MISNNSSLEKLLKFHSGEFHPVVNFNMAKDILMPLDFTENNNELPDINPNDIEQFSKYIVDKLQKHKAKFGFGGYDELRTLYNRSELFNKDLYAKKDSIETEEPRRLHLGIDIWGDAGTEVYAPVEGLVHSFAYNNPVGDYGATIILKHQIEYLRFYTLYGHLALRDIEHLKEEKLIKKGEIFAHLGNALENGHWPPHLHFQLIEDISTYKGDYPGVCKLSEREQYLRNSPDPDLILNMRKCIT